MNNISQENIIFPFPDKSIYQINDYEVKIIRYLGQMTDIHYFKVEINGDFKTLGLLRIGNSEGSLTRELNVRNDIQGYGLIAPILAKKSINSLNEMEIVSLFTDLKQPKNDTIEEQVEEDNINPENCLNKGDNERNIDTEKIQNNSQKIPSKMGNKEQIINNNEDSRELEEDIKVFDDHEKNDQEIQNAINLLQNIEIHNDYQEETEISQENNSIFDEQEEDYLEEEILESQAFLNWQKGEKIVILTQFPEQTLAQWLTEEHSLEEILLKVSQLCQCFKYCHKRQFIFTSIIPEFINIDSTLQIFDLTGIYHIEDNPESLWSNEYSPPEILTNTTLSETMSSYIIGLILYQAIHHKLPVKDAHLYEENLINNQLNIKLIPRLYQIINIVLAPDPNERFPLTQLLSLLIKTRQVLNNPQISYEIAHRSTVGLSLSRLDNEDNYGILYPVTSLQPPIILAGVADGMGGMAQGEVASELGIKTLLNADLSQDLTTLEKQLIFLDNLVQEANKNITTIVKNGGTTLSIILAVGNELNLAHVGDSRIYLIRNNKLKQLSEDHSLVSMLLHSQQITYEESLKHPDRNVLTKSLGSSRQLNDGYIQHLKESLILENNDIILLCSDGVWDLISLDEFLDIFSSNNKLQNSVNQVIEKVIEKGASDNATLVALKCQIQNNIYL
jgi:PPM family protein phosphatase